MRDHQKFNAPGLLDSDPSFPGRLRYWDNDLCAKKPGTFDIVLGLGGDGTVLYSSWLFQKIVPPVISFALGSLGFLTKFDFEAYPQILTRAISDGVTVGLRLRFEGTIMRSQKRENSKKRDLVEELIGEESEDHHTHRPDGTHNVMNEVVMDRGPNASEFHSLLSIPGFITNVVQQCPPSRYLVTTNISLPYKQMVYVWPLQQDQQHITWLLEALYATQRIPSFWLQRYARTLCHFGQSFSLIRWYYELAFLIMQGRAHGQVSMGENGKFSFRD